MKSHRERQPIPVIGGTADEDRVHKLYPACDGYGEFSWTACRADTQAHGGSSVDPACVTCLACLGTLADEHEDAVVKAANDFDDGGVQ